MEELADAKRLQTLWLRKKRELHLTQEQVAADCGWTQGAFGHYLHGRVSLNLEAVLKLARVLEVNPTEITERWLELIPDEAHHATREPDAYLLAKMAKNKNLTTWMVIGQAYAKEGMLDVAIRSNKPLVAKLRRKGREKTHSQAVERKKAV